MPTSARSASIPTARSLKTQKPDGSWLVKSRIANAQKDPTYLLSDVQIVAEYKLANIGRKALEALLHKFFAPARLDMELKDRFGAQVEPREWFLVPLPVIEEVIQNLKEGSIGNFRYDLETARLVSVMRT